MKHKKSLLILLSLPLLLTGIVSCDKTSDSTTGTITDTAKPTETVMPTEPKTDAPDVGSWDSEISGMMLDILGEEIPYIAMGKEASYYVYDVGTTTVLCLYDTSENSIVDQYGTILFANGYALEETDDSQGFNIYIYHKDSITIEVSYQPAGDGYDSGNVIQAYLDDGDITPDLTAWPDELKEMFTEHLGEEIPFAEMDSSSLFYNYVENGDYIFVTDFNNKNALTDYGTKLEEAGYSFLGTAINDDGDTVYSYTKKRTDKEGYSIHIEYYYQELYTGNYIVAYSEKDIILNESEIWPIDEIKTITTETIPSFSLSEGKYSYYYPETGIVIAGIVAEDITKAYEESLKTYGFLFDIDMDTYSVYAYNWIENTYVEYQYDEESKTFTIAIGPMQASYDSLDKTFPTEEIKALLGEDASEVPAFPIGDGDEYKVYLSNEDIYFEAIDKDSSIVESYKATLQAAGYTISEKEGETIAISAKEDVKLLFESGDGLFTLTVTKYTPVADGEFDFTNENLLEAEDDECSVWNTKTVTFQVEKGTSSTNVGNDQYFYNPLRIYIGQVITISTTEGTLKECTFITSGNKYSDAIAKATVTGGTAESYTGNSIKIICDENATSITITLNAQTRLTGLTVTKA